MLLFNSARVLTRDLGIAGWLVCLGWLGFVPSDQLQAQHNELTFEVANGLSLEKIAGESLIKWPMLADWDQDGHLVVIESGGVAKPIDKHNEQLVHRLVRLFDDNGDGIMDRRSVVADKLPFTEGLLCIGNQWLITAPPNIYRLTDGDGDGYCESRELWFDGQTLTGCANDLHGPYLGRDGWIYWCKGAFAKQSHPLVSGQILNDGAAHIHRRRLFGWTPSAAESKQIDTVMSGGMDNPVEVAFTPAGERFFTSTFLVHPGDGKRDGVAHAVFGGAYGKEHNALDGVVRTGSLMPIMTHLGPAAPSGLSCLNDRSILSDQPEPTLSDSAANPVLVAALFNTQKVIALPLHPVGSTYATQAVDLVVGNRIDFHPTDILEDADGSVLVIDTGGWYDLCCPTSRIDQFTAAGGIYRLRRTDQARQSLQPEEINWSAIEPNQAVELLVDPRPWIARRTLIKIASSGDWATDQLAKTLQDSPDLHHQLAALWALGAIGSQRSLQAVTTLLQRTDAHTNTTVQQAACHLISLHRHSPAYQAVARIAASACQQQHWPLARTAIEVLGRIGNDETSSLLMQFATHQVDRVFDHSLRYALYELNRSNNQRQAKLVEYLDSPQPAERNLALATLDLVDARQHLGADRLLQAALESSTAETAAALLVKRPELAESVLTQLTELWQPLIQSNQAVPALYIALASGWRDQPTWQLLVAKTLQATSAQSAWKWREQALASRAGHSIPATWFPWIQAALIEDPLRVGRWLEATNLTGKEQQPLVDAMLQLVQQQPDNQVKRQLLVSLPARPYYEDARLVDQLTASLSQSIGDSDQSNQYWKSLKRLKISRPAAERILALAPQMLPSDLAHSIELLAAQRDDHLDQRLLEQLPELRASRSLPPASLLNPYRDRSPALRERVKRVVDQLLAVDPLVAETVQQTLQTLPAGDPIRGLSLFHSNKANCGTCHQMGYRGGKIGPELSAIGSSRTRAALLEAILYPSQRIEQGFDTIQLLTVDGRVINGIITSRGGNEISVRVSADKIETVPLDQIEQQLPSQISIMPGGVKELLSPQELADLLSLLESAK